MDSTNRPLHRSRHTRAKGATCKLFDVYTAVIAAVAADDDDGKKRSSGRKSSLDLPQAESSRSITDPEYLFPFHKIGL